MVEDEDFVEATSEASQNEVVIDIGNLKLRMYQGDIIHANVDVIIHGTDITMDLSKGNISSMKTFL